MDSSAGGTVTVNIKTVKMKANYLPASENDPAETEFERISRKLGYRLRLVDATFSNSAKPGGILTIQANLNNDGYAGLIKKRPLFLVLDNGTHRYNIALNDVDVRTWISGPAELPRQEVTLPADMVPGVYTLALWLPDAAPGLRSRPEYAVRFANHDVWNAAKGYNVLSDAVVIGPGK